MNSLFQRLAHPRKEPVKRSGLGWSWFVLILMLLSGSWSMAQEASQPEPSPSKSSVPAPLHALSPRGFLQLLIARSVEIRYSLLSSEVARFLKRGEQALYESTGFVSLREEGRQRQRTADERLQNTFTASTEILDETSHTDEIGVRKKLPSGAELGLSYKVTKKSNNLISQTSRSDTEYNGQLSLSLKQPLLRNAGRSITETDLRIADLEHQIAVQQLTQQTLKSSIEGLSLYWQLYRAQETLRLRQELMANTQALEADTKARIAAGKLPAAALLELQGVMLNRQAELSRSQQALHEAQGKVLTAVDLTLTELSRLATTPIERTTAPSAVNVNLAQALERWSPYQISLLKRHQAQIRLDFAQNQTLPVADLVLSYSGTGYGKQSRSTRNTTEQARYPDWYFGFNFEIPLDGNQKAQQQFLAQGVRVTQAELEVSSIQNSFSNDFTVRANDLHVSYQLLQSSAEDVKLRQSIFDIEQQRINLGTGSLSTLIQRQVDLIEAKQRQLENQVRYELTLATWQYIQGDLLAAYQIDISTQATPQR